jgi:hypothetical protein
MPRTRGGLVNIPAGFLTELVSQLAAELAPLVADELRAGPSPTSAERWRLLDAEQAAEILGRSERWVRERTTRGDLPFVKLDDGGRMYDPEDLRAFAKARRIAANEPEALAARLQASRDPARLSAIRGADQVGHRRVG